MFFILHVNVFKFKSRSMISAAIAVTGTAAVTARASAGRFTRATAAAAAASAAATAAAAAICTTVAADYTNVTAESAAFDATAAATGAIVAADTDVATDATADATETAEAASETTMCAIHDDPPCRGYTLVAADTESIVTLLCALLGGGHGYGVKDAASVLLEVGTHRMSSVTQLSSSRPIAKLHGERHLITMMTLDGIAVGLTELVHHPVLQHSDLSFIDALVCCNTRG